MFVQKCTTKFAASNAKIKKFSFVKLQLANYCISTLIIEEISRFYFKLFKFLYSPSNLESTFVNNSHDKQFRLRDNYKLAISL